MTDHSGTKRTGAGRPDIVSVMTRNPQTIQASAYLNSAKVVLNQYDIQQLPVLDNTQITGIISVRDIERAEAIGVDTSIGSEVTVGDICNTNIYAVTGDEMLDDVLVYMALEHIDAALITTGDRLDGIFTVGDACNYCADLIRDQLAKNGQGSHQAA